MSVELKVAHCPHCGKVYQKNMRGMCGSCSAQEDAQMKAIESELKRNRFLSNGQLAELAGVPETLIRNWIRIGKLKLFDYPNLADACELCAEPIRKGKLCVKCATRIQADIYNEFERERKLKERLRAANAYKIR